MSTNDTLRGLLAEAKDYVNFCTTTEAGDLLNRISAALAEPVSGGVCMGCVDLSSHVRELEHKMDYYKSAADRVALNGGAVAGQGDAELAVLREYRNAAINYNSSFGAEAETSEAALSIEHKAEERFEAAEKACHAFYRQGRDACTCKPLESERGGE